MFTKHRTLLDLLVGAGLVVALLLVVLIDRLTSAPGTASKGPDTLDVRIVDDASRKLEASKKLRLAVVPSYQERDAFGTKSGSPWDDMGKLLRELGEGYKFDEVQPEKLLKNPRLLERYDVLFLTCAPRGKELKDQLTSFVMRGGTLYASDWRYDAVAAAFPEVVDQAAQGSGVKGNVQADVADPGLRELVGPSISLHFDLDSWKTAAFKGPRVDVLLRGRYKKQRFGNDIVGQATSAPLLVRFKVGKGTVIFTSFHNEKQNSDLEKLLQYLVFSLVTADIEALVAASIQEAGFDPQKSNLLSTPRENPSVSRTYNLAKPGPLRFALGFRNEGAQLRLTLQSPDGRTFSWEGASTVILEAPQAVVGEWTYTVTALKLPYENFPFTVTVSEKK